MTSSLGQSVVVVVDELTKVGEARRRSVALASELGLERKRSLGKIGGCAKVAEAIGHQSSVLSGASTAASNACRV